MASEIQIRCAPIREVADVENSQAKVCESLNNKQQHKGCSEKQLDELQLTKSKPCYTKFV